MRKLDINGGRAMENGLCLYSMRHKGYAAMATIQEEKIVTKWIKKKEKKPETFSDKFWDVMKKMFEPMIGLLIFGLTFYCTANTIISFRVTFIIGMIILWKKTQITIKDLPKKFHAAEHMVVNAYDDLGRVPTMEEIKRYSRFHNRCGTNLITERALKYLSLILCSFIPNLLVAAFSAVILLKIIPILEKQGYLNFLQRLTTEKPTNRELSVAIAALNLWVEEESK